MVFSLGWEAFEFQQKKINGNRAAHCAVYLLIKIHSSPGCYRCTIIIARNQLLGYRSYARSYLSVSVSANQRGRLLSLHASAGRRRPECGSEVRLGCRKNAVTQTIKTNIFIWNWTRRNCGSVREHNLLLHATLHAQLRSLIVVVVNSQVRRHWRCN